MCLSVVYRGKRKKEALAKLPESGYYWKAVEVENDGYHGPYWCTKPYKSGWNKAKSYYRGIGYKTGFLLFRNSNEAIRYKYSNCITPSKIIRCKVNKKDIVAIGWQGHGLCIVTTRFWCPKPR